MARRPTASAVKPSGPDADPDPAPNIGGTYPLAGERLGPAWRETWRALGTGSWMTVRVLALDIAPRHGLTPQALDAAIRAARHRGLLDTRPVVEGSRLIAVRRRDLPLCEADALADAFAGTDQPEEA